MKKLLYATMFAPLVSAHRLEVVRNHTSRTIQDVVVDIPTLLKQFNGDLKGLFDKYKNGLVFESDLTSVFVDELNPDELRRYNEFESARIQRENEQRKDNELFAKWKQEISKRVLDSRASSDGSGQTEELKSVSSTPPVSE